jgi:aspartate beta-hydroxylase
VIFFRRLDREKSKLRFLEASERWLEESEEKFGVHKRLRRGVRILQKRERAPVGDKSPSPHLFLIPDVKTRPVFDVNDFPWIEGVRSGFGEIKKEMERNDALWKREAMPYADSDVITSRKFGETRESWHQLPLAKHRSEFERTWSILEGSPAYEPSGPHVCLLSSMKPTSHIPPHTGLSNNRLIFHLPLTAPEGCGLRVADKVIDVNEGEPYLFDDCFQHEAWNHSDQKRVVLIFAINHPGLETDEMQAVRCFLKGYRSYRKSLKRREREFILDHFEVDYGDD